MTDVGTVERDRRCESATSLWLGTAQLGLRYGIANRSGRPSTTEARAIVDQAFSCDYAGFDTARAYGESEVVLGACLQGREPDARVVTKLDPSVDVTGAAAIREAVRLSLARLGRMRLWGLLLHREDLLSSWPGATGRALRGLVDEGLVAHIGVSVYSPHAALAALAADGLDLIQLPANCVDRRMERAGIAARAAERGVQVHVRSAFLQGLLLMAADAVPARIPRARAAVAALDEFVCRHGLERRTFALQYVRYKWPGAGIVVGAESSAQVAENRCALDAARLDDGLAAAWDATWPEDELPLVNPALWPREDEHAA